MRTLNGSRLSIEQSESDDTYIEKNNFNIDCDEETGTPGMSLVSERTGKEVFLKIYLVYRYLNENNVIKYV